MCVVDDSNDHVLSVWDWQREERLADVKVCVILGHVSILNNLMEQLQIQPLVMYEALGPKCSKMSQSPVTNVMIFRKGMFLI